MASTPAAAGSDGGAAAPRQYSLSQFQAVRELGNGSFGVVKQVVHKDTGEIFAMKVLEKKKVVERKLQEQLKREVLTQLKANHPNVVRMHYYFEDSTRVYCLLEYADEGQLFAHLREHGVGLPEPRAAAFFADTASGLQYLHGLGVAHRDLKPENILLFGEALRAKLGDLGWCAEVSADQPRSTFCGTMDYLAPEMLLSEPHDTSVDLWALGVLLYEMIMARAPFTASSQKEAIERICAARPEIPASAMSQGAAEITSGLLQREKRQRMPLVQVLAHPWVRTLAGSAQAGTGHPSLPLGGLTADGVALEETRAMVRPVPQGALGPPAVPSAPSAHSPASQTPLPSVALDATRLAVRAPLGAAPPSAASPLAAASPHTPTACASGAFGGAGTASPLGASPAAPRPPTDNVALEETRVVSRQRPEVPFPSATVAPHGAPPAHWIRLPPSAPPLASVPAHLASYAPTGANASLGTPGAVSAAGATGSRPPRSPRSPGGVGALLGAGLEDAIGQNESQPFMRKAGGRFAVEAGDSLDGTQLLKLSGRLADLNTRLSDQLDQLNDSFLHKVSAEQDRQRCRHDRLWQAAREAADEELAKAKAPSPQRGVAAAEPADVAAQRAVLLQQRRSSQDCNSSSPSDDRGWSSDEDVRKHQYVSAVGRRLAGADFTDSDLLSVVEDSSVPLEDLDRLAAFQGRRAPAQPRPAQQRPAPVRDGHWPASEAQEGQRPVGEDSGRSPVDGRSAAEPPRLASGGAPAFVAGIPDPGEQPSMVCFPGHRKAAKMSAGKSPPQDDTWEEESSVGGARSAAEVVYDIAASLFGSLLGGDTPSPGTKASRRSR